MNALLIGLIAFLTVVDLFATQAILPALARTYATTPAVMSFAVNACTIGMAVAGLAMAVVGRRIDRRIGILLSLVLLSIPTLLLSTMPARCRPFRSSPLCGSCRACAWQPRLR
jgi:MFS transporter, YNFM family, putative membrane transport protein